MHKRLVSGLGIALLSGLGLFGVLHVSSAQAETSAPTAPPPPPPITGTRWQQTCENIPGGRLDFRVKERGQSGWELVTVLNNDNGFIACFKRPG